MKSLTNLALAAALAAGLAASPAAAAKEAPAAAKGPNFSKEFRAAAGPLQKALQAKDYAAAAAALPAANTAASTPDDKYYAARFGYVVAVNNKDDAASRAAAEAMIASGAAPADELPKIQAALGQQYYFVRDYPKAIAALNEAIRLGSKSPDLFVMDADANFKLKQYPAGLALAEQGVAAQKASGQPVVEDWYNRGLSAAYNARSDADIVKWSAMLVKAYPTPSNWRSVLVLYRDAKSRDPQLTLDMYRLMRATKSIAGERDYYDYAAIASERGLPGETKAVVDMAIASDAKLATSKNLSELRAVAQPKIAADLASLPASEKAAANAPTGRQAMGAADGYLSYGQDAKAIPLYRLALQKGGVDADVANIRLGIALARTGDKEGAKAAFALVKGARADLAVLWQLYLDAPVA